MMPNQQTSHSWLTSELIGTAIAVISSVSHGPAPARAQSCNSNDATAACFAQNHDILGGQRHLLRIDDLVVNFPALNEDDVSTRIDPHILETSGGKVSSHTIDTVIDANCRITDPRVALGNRSPDALVDVSPKKIGTTVGAPLTVKKLTSTLVSHHNR